MIRRTQLQRITPLKRSGPIARNTRVKAKRSKPRRGRLIDAAYKAWVASLPCVCCLAPLYKLRIVQDCLVFGMEFPFRPGHSQETPTEVAHVGERGLGQKSSDRETLPLCAWHHRTGPKAHHVLGKAFFAHHELDRGWLISELQTTYQALRKAA